MRSLAAALRVPVSSSSPHVVGFALAVPLALVLARLLPATGPGLGLRLAAATACVLVLPGALLVRAVGAPDDIGAAAASSFLWSLALVFGALVVTFGVGGSLSVTLVLLAVVTLAALLPAAVGPRVEIEQADLVVVAAVGALGTLLSVVVWAGAGEVVGGDALFHLARERKLVDLDHLTSLRAVTEFRDGSLHPGYAFPLWHGVMALVSLLAGVDPAAVARYEPVVLVPLSFVLVFAAGRALFDSAWTGAAAVIAQGALIGLATGHGGGYTALSQPGAAARQLVIPALLALAFAYVRDRTTRLLPAIAVGGLTLALIHPAYGLFFALVFAGFLLVRGLLVSSDVAPTAAALAALVVPTGAVAFWLLPIVRQTISHEPGAAERARSIVHYRHQLEILSSDSFRLSPGLVGRSGAVAVAALLLIPLAALAPRRRWAAFVLGASLTVLVLTLVPELFTRLSDVVSLSQGRRLAGFVPFAFAFAGGLAVLARVAGPFLPPLALGAGVVLQWLYPGDQRFRFESGAVTATWIAAFGGALGLALAVPFARRLSIERHGPVVTAAAAMFVLPVAVNGLREWGPREVRGKSLSPGLVHALRTEVPEGDVVYSDMGTSYRIAAYAPVYVANGPPAHVADTTANRPYDRRRDAVRFSRTGDLSIPRSYGARWLVLDMTQSGLRPSLPRVYGDGRYVLYRLPPVTG